MYLAHSALLAQESRRGFGIAAEVCIRQIRDRSNEPQNNGLLLCSGCHSVVSSVREVGSYQLRETLSSVVHSTCPATGTRWARRRTFLGSLTDRAPPRVSG